MSEEARQIAKCPIYLTHFTWIKDFAAARNFNFKDVKTDYVMWMDLDDRLSSKTEFIRWRDNVMQLADFWMNPYNYALDPEGKPVCVFIRERVIKTSKKFTWQFKIHEGMIADEPVQAQMVNNWTVDHHRTPKDYEKDFTRNVSMLEEMAKQEELPVRLKFYYGKELFDKGRHQEAYTWLDQVVDAPKLEHHDRVLCFEYLIRSCLHRFHQEQEYKPIAAQDQTLLAKGLALALQGATLEPNRAEFWCLAGDVLIKMNRFQDALPMYSAATKCSKNNTKGFLFVSHAAYEHVPRDQMARLQFQMGDLDGAIATAKESFEKFHHEETGKMLTEMLNTKEKIKKFEGFNKVQTDEVVFSCIPNSHPYPFDEQVYKEKGIGGSETALVEVAKYLKTMLPNRRIIVFNTRDHAKTCESGVEYLPASQMHEYFGKYEPEVHFAWRHNVKLTNARTYLWCHDLFTPGAEAHQNYIKHICLSEFHKEYVQVIQGIPADKIHVSRNGVNAWRFKTTKKNPNKIVFPSSPDRGLEFAISIVEKARRITGQPLELHVYYGIEHLEKYGPQMAALAERLRGLFAKYDWVKYHGNVDQQTLANEMCEAVVWLYPANFIETYCITALEAMYAHCFPLAREIGALRDTLRPFHEAGMAQLLFRDPFTDEDQEVWANELARILKSQAWTKIDLDGFDYSWAGVARDFVELTGLVTQAPRPQHGYIGPQQMRI